MKEIIDLEHRGWEALSAGSGTAAEFYGELLLEDAVMLFPSCRREASRGLTYAWAETMAILGVPTCQTAPMSGDATQPVSRPWVGK